MEVSEKKISMFLIDNEVHNHVLTSDEDSCPGRVYSEVKNKYARTRILRTLQA